MKVRIIQGYTDSILGRIVYRDEEFSVSESRAKRLVGGGVAVEVSEDITDYIKRIKDLEEALTQRDTKISVLEEALKKNK